MWLVGNTQMFPIGLEDFECEGVTGYASRFKDVDSTQDYIWLKYNTTLQIQINLETL